MKWIFSSASLTKVLPILMALSFSMAVITVSLSIFLINNPHWVYTELIIISSGVLLFLLANLWYATHKTNKIKEALMVSLNKKNTYLEHAAKILRHDMHSGINVYIPRGVKSLERRLTPEQIKDLKIEAPLKMIKEGLTHTQNVYNGVYEFTNLVKNDAVLEKAPHNIKTILDEYLKSTSYKSQVILEGNLPVINVNKSLFCTAIDNLIRNGLKYNDSESKLVRVYLQGNFICVEDNGRGMSQDDFNRLSKPYVRKKDQKEQGTGLGLNICTSILDEHKFKIYVEKLDRGLSEFYKDFHDFEGKFINATNVVFEKEKIEKMARENNYLGKIQVLRGGRNKTKLVVVYKEGSIKDKEFNKGTKIKIKIK